MDKKFLLRLLIIFFVSFCVGFFLVHFQDKEVVITSPIRIREKVLSPVDEDWLNRELMKNAIREIIDEEVEKRVEQENKPNAVLQSNRVERKRRWVGIASWYSVNGCVGCREDRLMANGERLRDDGATIAFNKLPLGSWVRVRNLNNNMIVRARVTDRGGFEKYGRIADLTPYVRDMINCSDLCKVEILALDD